MFQAELPILCNGAITFGLKSHLIAQLEENLIICKNKRSLIQVKLRINSNFH